MLHPLLPEPYIGDEWDFEGLESYIYIALTPGGFLKIGYSRNPNDRVRGGAFMAYPPKLLGYAAVGYPAQAEEVEQALHLSINRWSSQPGTWEYRNKTKPKSECYRCSPFVLMAFNAVASFFPLHRKANLPVIPEPSAGWGNEWLVPLRAKDGTKWVESKFMGFNAAMLNMQSVLAAVAVDYADLISVNLLDRRALREELHRVGVPFEVGVAFYVLRKRCDRMKEWLTAEKVSMQESSFGKPWKTLSSKLSAVNRVSGQILDWITDEHKASQPMLSIVS